MTSAIEERVVEMQFNNQDFEKNVNQSLNTIDKLKAALDFRGAAKGMDEISNAADKFDVSNIVSGIEAVKAKFNALDVVGFTVIQELTKAFLGFGKKIWDISFGQMKSGGMARALKIEQANFKMRALLKNMEGIGDQEDKIVAKMNEIGDAIDRAVTGTAYGYDTAANVAAQLMASGMRDADKMYDYLRGIAGAAAMTGRSFEDIGNIFTTISSNGKLMTMQLRQFSSAGLNISAELARQMNTSEAAINDMVSHGRISFEQFAQAMYDAFGESAGKADETYAGVTTNIRAQLSRIGQLFAVPYIENMIPALQKLKAMLKSLNSALSPIANRFDKFMHVVGGWLETFFESVDFKRLDNLFRGVENIFWGLVLVFNSVRLAFMEMFPPKTLDELNAAALGFEKFTEALLPTDKALEGIKYIIEALLIPVQFLIKKFNKFKSAMQPVIIAVVQLGYTLLSLVGHIAKILVDLTEGVRQGESFNSIMGMIGYTVASVIFVLNQFLEVIDAIITSFKQSETGGKFTALIKEVGDLINRVIIGALGLVLSLMMKIASAINVENVMAFLNGISGILQFIVNGIEFVMVSILNGLRVVVNGDTIIGHALRVVKEFVKTLVGFFKGDKTDDHIEAISGAMTALKDKLREVGDSIKAFINDIDGRQITFYAFAAAVILLIFTFQLLLSKLTDLVFQSSRAMAGIANITNITTRIKQVTTHAKMFLYFAASILLIVGALYELTSLPADKLQTSATILFGFGMAMVAFSALMVAVSKSLRMLPTQNGFINALAKFIFGLSASIALLALAMHVLADTEMTAKQALTTVGIITSIMLGLATATTIMHSISGVNMDKGTISFIAFALAVDILVKTISKISKEDLDLTWQNILFLLGLIASIGLAMSLTGTVSFGASFTVLAYAVLLKTVLGAFMDLVNMPLDTMLEGIKRIFNIIEAFIPLIIIASISNRIAGGVGAFANITSFMTSLIIFMLVVSTVVKSLSRIEDPEKVSMAVDVITTILGELTAAFAVITAVMGVIAYFLSSKMTLPVSTLEMGKLKVQRVGIALKGMAAIFIGLAVGVSLLTLSVKAIANSEATMPDYAKALAVFLAITVIITAAINSMLFMSSFTRYSKLGPTLVSVMAALIMIIGVITAIGMLGVLPDNVVKNINEVLSWRLLACLAIITAFVWGLSMKGRYSKEPPTGMNGRIATIVELISFAIIVLSIFVPLFLMVDSYAKNIDKFKNGLTDLKPLGVLLLVYFGLVIGLVVSVTAIGTKLSSLKLKPITIQRVMFITGMVAALYALVAFTFAVLLGISANMPEGQAGRIVALSVSIGVIMAALVGVYWMMADVLSIMPNRKYNLKNLITMGASMAIMSAIFISIGLSISLLASTLQNVQPGTILPVIAVMMLVLAEFAIIMHFFADKTYFNFKWSKLLAFAGGIAILGAVFIAIAAALRLMPNGGNVKKLALLGGMVIALGIGLFLATKFGKDIRVDSMLGFASGVALLSSVLVVIAACLKILDGVYISPEVLATLALMEVLILALSSIVWIMASSGIFDRPEARGGMIAFAASIAAFAVGFVSISTSIKMLAQSLNNITTEELKSIVGTLTVLSLVMAAFLAIGATVGVASGGLTIIAIASTAAAFLAMGASLYFAAEAINAYTDAMIKMRHEGIGASDLVNSFADGAAAIRDRIPDFASSVLAIILAIASVIVGSAPVIAAAITLVLAMTIGYFLYALLVMEDTLLHGLALFIDGAAEWFKSGEGATAMYNLGFIVTNGLINGILGALDGLGVKIMDAVVGKNQAEANAENIANITRNVGDAVNAEDVWNTKLNITHPLKMAPIVPFLGPIGVIAANQLIPDVEEDLTNWQIKAEGIFPAIDGFEDADIEPLFEATQKILDQNAAIEECSARLQEGTEDTSHYVDVIKTSLHVLSGQGEVVSDLFSKTPLLFQSENESQLNELMDKTKINTVMNRGLTELKTAYDNGVISLEEYEDSLIQMVDAIRDIQYVYSEDTGDFEFLGDLLAEGGLTEAEYDKYEQMLNDTNTYIKLIGDRYREVGGNIGKLQNAIKDQPTSVMSTLLQSTELVNEAQAMREVGVETAQSFSEGFEEGMDKVTSGRGRRIGAGGAHAGGGARGNITKIIPPSGDFVALGKQNAKAYNDGLSDGLENVGDTVKDETDEDAKGFFASFVEDLSQMAEDFNIPTTINVSNADGLTSWVKGLIPEEWKTKWSIYTTGIDVTSQEYLDLIDYANFNLGGKERWRQEGYDSADAYARAKLGADGNTTGFDRVMKTLGISDMMEEATAGLNEAVSNATSNLDSYSGAADSAATATDTLADSIHNALDIFSEFNVDLSMTANDVLRNFSSQLVGVTDWSKELSALAGRGISKAVLEDLAAAGPEAYDRVHALYTASASQLALFNAMYEQKLSLEKSTANDIRESFEKNGSVIAEGAKDVVASATTEIATVQDQVVAASQIGVNEMEQGVLDAHKIGMEFEYVNGVIIPEGIKDAIKNSTPGVAAVFGEMGYQSLEAFKHYMNVEDAITMVEGFQEALKESIGNSLDIFAEVSDKEEISSEEMLRRMRENIKNVGKWANDLRSLAARGMDEALLAELQALGPAGADKVAAFAKMTDSQLKQANQAFAAKVALPQYVADNLTKSYAEAGFNTTLGFVEGIDPTAAEEVMTALGTYSLDALKASLDIHSPSEKTREAGMYSVMGMVIGVEENLPMIEDVGTKMGDALLSSCFSVNPEKLAASVAMFMTAVQGAVTGYQDKKGTDWMASYEEWIFNELLARLEEIDKRGEFQLHVTPVWTAGSGDMERLAVKYQNANKTMGWNAARDALIKNNGAVPTSVPSFSIARSINAANNIKTTPANTGYANELHDISQLLKATRDEVSGIRGNVSQLQVAFAGMQVTLDGATVGKMMTPYVNANLGNTYVRDKRRKL